MNILGLNSGPVSTGIRLPPELRRPDTEFGEFRRSLKTFLFAKGVFIATQLNSTDPVEQRTAKSVVFLFMTSRPTN